MYKNKRTIWKFYTSIDAEEVFINEMCKKGWKLCGIILGSRFEFIKCNPGEFICKTYFTVDKNGSTDKRKNAIMRNNLISIGAEIIEERFNMETKSHIYALRKAELGAFEIRNDLNANIEEVESRMKYHTNYGVIFMALGAMILTMGNIFVAILEMLAAIFMLLPVSKYKKKLIELKKQREIIWQHRIHSEESTK